MNILSLKSKGRKVSELQYLLQQLGYDITVNSIFDEQTERIVRLFQSSHNLPADGVVAVNTWKEILFLINESMESIMLKEQDLEEVACQLSVPIAAIKAVREVETGGRSGFLKPNIPRIRFEGQVFYRELDNKGLDVASLAESNPDIIYPEWDGIHYKPGVWEYDRLDKAAKIDETAALSSTSWGMFNMMGFNYKYCGFDSVQQMSESMKRDEASQLKAFITYLKGADLVKYLQALDWRTFARQYKGALYMRENYDDRLAQAFEKFQ